MDKFGDAWTPFAVLRRADEAIELCEMLRCDADAVCRVPDWYDTAEDVVRDKPSAVGKFIVSELTADDILDAVQ